jgi:hypothetical protein
MNKKGQQYYQPQQPTGGAPLPVVLGVICIAGPMIARIWNFNVPFTGFFYGLGIFLIIVGVIMYALKQ